MTHARRGAGLRASLRVALPGKQPSRRETALRGYELRHAAGAGSDAGPRVRVRHRAPAPGLPSWRAFVGSGPRAASLLGLCAVLTVAAHLTVSSRYVVVAPTVVGNTRVPAALVQSAAAVDGQRLFRIDTAAVEARVSALPEVRSAKVTARLPNEVTIAVGETTPRFVWSTPTGDFLVDENGRALALPASSALGEPAPQAAGLPRIEDRTGVLANPGDKLSRAAMAAAAAYQPLFNRLAFRQDVGFIGVTKQGWEVYLGTDATRAPRQTTLLGALDGHLAPVAHSVAFIDLRFSRPYYRLSNQGNG